MSGYVRELTEEEKKRIKNVIKGMRADELICAVSVIPTTVLSAELERRDAYVSATLTNIRMILDSETQNSSIVECQNIIRAIRSIVK